MDEQKSGWIVVGEPECRVSRGRGGLRAGAWGLGFLLWLGAWPACGDDDGQSNQNENLNNNNSASSLCGNGQVEGVEECDDGALNSDSAPDACRTDCREARCGDDVADEGEECDEGPRNSDAVPDACRPDCTAARCGDGVVDVGQGETCDDGNEIAGDGCHACLVEYCGNGRLDPGEVCDDGNLSPSDDCTPDCQSTGVCGNGIVDAAKGETCDCGEDEAHRPAGCDTVNSWAVGASCRPGCQLPGCGDGVVEGAEQCDGTNLAGTDCQGLGFYFESPLSCRDDCTFDTTGCLGRCGDLARNGLEMCDTDDLDGRTCADFGFYGGTLKCSPICGFDTSVCQERCGDGIPNGPEACDQGGANSNTAPDTCRLDCTLPRCGDGVLDAGEACDDGNNVSGDDCSGDCQSDETCGNGVVDGLVGEECDDGLANSDSEPDACRTTCVLPRCGDGVVDSLESCDLGSGNSELPNAACRTNCQARRCGDLVVDDAFEEVCDDGNLASKDGCSGDCKSEEWCGNGYVDALLGEQCDDLNLRSRDGCSSRCQVEVPNWVQEDLGSPSPRISHALAFDAARGVTVLFGGARGEGSGGIFADTWEHDGTSWARKTPSASPPGLLGHAMAFDGSRGRVLLFGGENLGKRDLTWEYDGLTWAQVATAHAPPPRDAHSMAYDSARDRVVLFGGFSSSYVSLGDTWEYDGTDWTQVVTALGPSARSHHRMTYDSARGKVILFGGRLADGDPAFADTWEYDGVQWTLVPTPHTPAGRLRFGMAFDAQRGRTVLYGGNDGFGVFGFLDTWEYDGVDWVERIPATPPPPRYHHDLAYDARRGAVLLFGGEENVVSYGDTWTFTGGEWAEILVGAAPSPRVILAMAYDVHRGRAVLFGGWDCAFGYYGDTWEHDGARWIPVFSGGAPPERSGHAMAYDSDRRRVVLFGGESDSVPGHDDTWEWDGTEWEQVVTSTAPEGRRRHAMVYDEHRGRVVLFGGWTTGGWVSETWEYDGLDWIPVVTPTSPPALDSQGMAYDSIRHRVVMQGGYPVPYDTWEYDGTDWSLRSPTAVLEPRWSHAMAFDSTRARSIVFGGNQFGETYTNDTWEWDGEAWMAVTPIATPPGRRDHAMVHHRALGKLLLFGGIGGSCLGDTWTLGYGNTEPVEVCRQGEDADQDLLAHCADPDCEWQPFCLACGDGLCEGGEHCGSCPEDCGSCAGCSAADLQLSEVHAGPPAFLEIVNRGSCVWDVGGLTVLFQLDCDEARQAFTFPRGSVVAPGGVFRAVASLGGTLAGEVSTGAPICDTPAGEGWALLCDGFCDLTTCGNVLDTFAKQGITSPVMPTACVSFEPAPLSVLGAGAGDSATRVGFAGGGAAGQRADWEVRPVSRD